MPPSGTGRVQDGRSGPCIKTLQKPQPLRKIGIDLLVHLNCLLFLHQLAEENGTQAFQNKSKIINYLNGSGKLPYCQY
uniref:Uncharacterized protein n=1 Tax=Vombatus ursinus TaxID=29139 RepID=A0A4X2KAM7_VOMUR